MSTLTVATIKSNNTSPPAIQNSSGTEIGTLCRAWVNFDGTAATPITPRASFNVSSVTKNGTGDYTINFTNSLPDANYSILTNTYPKTTAQNVNYAMGLHTASLTTAPTLKSTSQVRLFISASNVSGGTDMYENNVSVFR